MKKIQVIALALLAVCASCAIITSSVSAAELLSGAAKITALLFIELSGSVLLEDMKASVLGNPDLLCTGILDGMIEAGGRTGVIEFLLMSNGELLTPAGVAGTPGDGLNDMIDCPEDDTKLCTPEILVTTLGMPWSFEIELETIAGVNTYFLTLLRPAGKVPAYTVECDTSLGTVVDTCETEEGTATRMLLGNEAGGLLAGFSENNSTTSPSKCSLGGAMQGLIAGDVFVTDPEGGVLTVSE